MILATIASFGPIMSLALMNNAAMPRMRARDDYHSATGQNVQEAQKLVKAGFEYVCDFDGDKLFRKRK